jgi:hypothetical protein
LRIPVYGGNALEEIIRVRNIIVQTHGSLEPTRFKLLSHRLPKAGACEIQTNLRDNYDISSREGLPCVGMNHEIGISRPSGDSGSHYGNVSDAFSIRMKLRIREGLRERYERYF